MTLPIDHRAGTHLGPFVLGNVVGQGGMGVVYAATRAETGETVALKLMSPELSSSEEFRQRFLNEAAVGPIMDHPNVVPIYGSGEAEGELYIAMKLIEGRNLKEVLKAEGALEPKRALRIFRQVASALDAAHESGMVHRDIKPQNILLATDDGHHDLAYVSDFGLVKPMSSDTSASRTGQVFGSLPYMAPEQIEAMEMDGRADVYALACVVFESLTGKPPFERPNEVAVVWAHVHEEPPLVTELRKELPGGIDGVVMQALSKHPDDRFLTCGEFIEAFEQGLGRQRSRVSRAMRPLVARTPRPKTEREVWGANFFPELSRIRKVQRKIDWLRAAAAIGVLSLVALAATQLTHPEGLSGAARDVSALVESTTNGVVDLVAPGTRPPMDDARMTGLAGIERHPFEVLEGSTSGRRVRGDGSVTDTQDDPAGSGSGTPFVLGDPSLKDTLILFGSYEDSAGGAGLEYDIYSMTAAGEEKRRIISSPTDDFDADLSVQGKVAFASQRAGDYDIYISNLDGKGVQRLTTAPNVCEENPNWSPDGSKIVYMNVCWYSASGSTQGDIIVMNADGSNKTNLTQTPSQDDGFADWSPDGSKIVFSSGPYGGNYEIYVMNADGTGKTRLTTTPVVEYGPTWSPDGTKIAFVRRSATDANERDIFVMNADGTRESQLTDDNGRELVPQWSPDGTKILYYRQGDLSVYVMDADGSHKQRLTEGWAMSWQPAYFKEVSVDLSGRRVSGQLSSIEISCTRYQKIDIQRRTTDGWRTVGRTASDVYGRFSFTLKDAAGSYRARSPFVVEERGRLCGPAVTAI